MTKRFLTGFLILSGLIAFATQNAFALNNVSTAYIAKEDGSGGYTEKLNQNFNWGKRPFLYVEGTFNKIFETWTSPTALIYSFKITDDGNKDLLFDPGVIVNDLPSWNQIREAGIWNWSVQAWRNDAGVGDILQGSFNLDAARTTTPEPISSALFLLGSGTLIARTIRNKKNKKS